MSEVLKVMFILGVKASTPSNLTLSAMSLETVKKSTTLEPFGLIQFKLPLRSPSVRPFKIMRLLTLFRTSTSDKNPIRMDL